MSTVTDSLCCVSFHIIITNKLVNKYADEADENGNVKVAEVHIPAFSTAMGELMEEEFEIEGIKPIKFPAGLKLSPIEMGLMEEVVDMSVFLDDDDG